ncbi:MAG TPA: hypothetical protein VLL52_10365 [Anaerolineae bacterium]|nr:hypothetical protein [Anaerolineae bacterium]
MNIWKFQSLISRRLLMWAVTSIIIGWRWLRQPHPFRRGLGLHFTTWGLIDALIALGGARAAHKRRQHPQALSPQTLRRETKKLRRLLWLNAGLDVGYIYGGWHLWRSRGATDAHWRGQGIGIIIQGAFLLIFDCWHAWYTPQPPTISTKDSIK